MLLIDVGAVPFVNNLHFLLEVPGRGSPLLSKGPEKPNIFYISPFKGEAKMSKKCWRDLAVFERIEIELGRFSHVITSTR